MIHILTIEQRCLLMNQFVHNCLEGTTNDLSYDEMIFWLTKYVQDTYNVIYIENNDPRHSHYVGALSGDDKKINWMLLHI